MVRRRDARRVARVTSGAADYLRNVLVPDGNGGDYHLDFVLLTSRGVVIIDMRDIVGIVFGGDQMTAWTLMSGARRTTFVNPQAGLYDRIASVKAIATDTPIEGRIVFTKRAKFPKGLPRFTVMLESVAAEFPKLGAAELEIAVAKYRPGWAQAQGSRQAEPALPERARSRWPDLASLRLALRTPDSPATASRAGTAESRSRDHRAHARLAGLRAESPCRLPARASRACT